MPPFAVLPMHKYIASLPMSDLCLRELIVDYRRTLPGLRRMIVHVFQHSVDSLLHPIKIHTYNYTDHYMYYNELSN